MRYSSRFRGALACALVTAVWFGAARAADPVELVGQLPIDIPTADGFVTDVWGWVHPTTLREYAIVGTDPRGIHIVDVTDPANPVLAKYIDNVPGFDMKTWDHYLYVCEGGSGPPSRIIDIADPANPVLLPAQLPTAHNIAIADYGVMYMNWPSLRALDLLPDPTNPSLWFSGAAGGHDITPRGNIVYDFSGTGGGCRIYTYAGSHTLLLLGTAYDGGIFYYHSGDQSSDGKYLFICDETATHPTADISIFNIQTPSSPQLVGTLGDPTATAHNLFVVGNVAYVSYYTAGFKAFNISDPAHPSLIGRYDTTAQAGECYCAGAFGVYPFSPSGNVFVSDWDNGLFIFRLTTTVPVRFTDVSARPSAGGVRVSWSVWSDETIEGFRVYRRGPGSDRNHPLTPADLPSATRAFLDSAVLPGGVYTYVVSARDADGDENLSAPVTVAVPSGRTGLLSVHPNPFHPATRIEFETAAAGRVRLEVFDARGTRVRVLFDAEAAAGRRAAAWDGFDDRGRAAASGVYFARLSAGKHVSTRRMVLLR
jgi:hypothetical protein